MTPDPAPGAGPEDSRRRRPTGVHETPEVRLRRLRLRSWRRGTREMDLVLGRFADAALDGLDADAMAAFESLLAENDHDLFRWVSGQASIPSEHRSIVGRIVAYHRLG
jgi:antitoxin CptB